MQTNDGRLIVIAGKSRSGKSALTVRAVKNSHRVCAWDPEDQWARLPGWKRVTTRRDLLEAMKKPGRMRVAYVVNGDLHANFEYWAAAVYAAGRHVEPLDVIAEEVADVTTTAKAPGSWGIILRRGLKRGINIYAISQRWAEADKTALNNASEFWMCSMWPQDAAYVAKKTGLQADEIAALQKIETETTITCQYMLFDADTRKTARGELKFKKK